MISTRSASSSRSADVFTVGFATFPERLIVDTRSNERETPMIQVVEPARSARDRMVWLSRRRPSLGAPEAFSFFAWPHSPNFMLQSGIWDRIRRRVDADIDSEVGVQCDLAIKQLLNLDREATLRPAQRRALPDAVAAAAKNPMRKKSDRTPDLVTPGRRPALESRPASLRARRDDKPRKVYSDLVRTPDNDTTQEVPRAQQPAYFSR